MLINAIKRPDTINKGLYSRMPRVWPYLHISYITFIQHNSLFQNIAPCVCSFLSPNKSNDDLNNMRSFRYWYAHHWYVSSHHYVTMLSMALWTHLILRDQRQTRVSSTHEQTNNVDPCNVPVHAFNLISCYVCDANVVYQVVYFIHWK